MTEYAILLENGSVVTGPGWACVADVMAPYAGFGAARVYGTLVRRDSPTEPWLAVAGHP